MSITTSLLLLPRNRSSSGTTVDLPAPGAPVTTNNLVTLIFSPGRATPVRRLTFELVEVPGSPS